jgi:hypothetical protein
MTAKIPIEIISAENDGHHIIIRGKINKKERFLLIDTGASKSVFNMSLLKIKTKEDISIYQNYTSAATITPDEIPSTTGNIKEIELQELKIYKLGAAGN